jgi:hypothetical protein
MAHDVAHRLARDAQHVLGLPRRKVGDQLAIDLHREARRALIGRRHDALDLGHEFLLAVRAVALAGDERAQVLDHQVEVGAGIGERLGGLRRGLLQPCAGSSRA